MGIVFKNNAKTTLASSLSNSATSATVADGAVFPSLSAGEHFLITFDDGSNNEICKCTARSGNTLTIVRAQESTTARAFSSGDAAEGRVTAGVLETIQENIAAKSANQTVFNATTSGNATTYNIGVNPGVEANAMVFLNGVLQHHDTISFSGVNLTFDAAPPNGMALEVIVDNLINLQSSNLTVDSFTAADVGGSPQTAFTLSDSPAAETNLIVFVEGVFQDQDAYTISSNTLTITTGVIAGRGVTVYIINPVNIGTPSDGTVTSAKLSGNITTPGTLTVGSHDVAFDSPTFVVDNANSRVGLGTASPSVPVDIVGDVKMSANLTVDTTTLVVDSSNNRVGIGQTPGDDFEVKTDNAMSFTSDTSDSISFGTSGTNKPCIKFDTANTTHTNRVWAIENGQGDRLNFFRNGLDVFKLNQDGSVEIPGKLGIGVSPANKLEIQHGTIGTGNGSNNTLALRYNSTTLYGQHYMDANGLYHIRADAQGVSGGNLILGGDNSVQIWTGSTPESRVTVDASGAVGIGVVPQTNRFAGHNVLQIGARGTLLANDTGSSTGQTAFLDNLFYNSAGSFRVRDGSNATAGVAMQFVEGNTIFSNSAATTGDPTVIERMRIHASGAIQHSAAASVSGVISRTTAPSGSQGLNITASVVTGLPTTTPTFADNNSSGASIYLGGNAVDQYGGSVILKAYGAGADGNLIVFENRSGTNTFKETMRIGSAGNVTKPTQCNFLAIRNGNQTGYNASGSYGDGVRYNSEIYDIGGDFDVTTGIFTAPVDGTYLIQGSVYTSTSGVTWSQAWLAVNNARANFTDMMGNDGDNFISTTHIVKLSAGDEVRYHPYYSGSTSVIILANNNHTWFKGYLLG